MNDYSGYSLIELLITLTVLSIVLAMGVPSVVSWVRAMEVRSSAESLRSALQRARAEAVARNTRVRISLSNATGNPGWNVTCVNAAAVCPASLLSHTIETNNLIRWGASLLADSSTMTTALKAGAALPATIDFFPLGDAPQITGGTDIARVDVIHSASADDVRLIVRIDGAGNIRLCNPSRPTDHPEACH
jgi:type IV fimbrial biogenesis protein FimT